MSHPGVIRIWRAGVEDGKNTRYDIYISVEADISRIDGAGRGADNFKNPPQETNIVPGDLPFDSPLLKEEDRGVVLRETVRGLRGILELQ